MATASAGVRRDGEGGRCHAPLCEIERATDECRRLSGRPWMQGQQPRGPAVREGTRGGGRLRRHFRDFTAGARASAFGGVLVVLIALVRSRARAFDIASAGYPV